MGIRAHVHKTWEAVACINFNLNDCAVEADDGAGIDFGEHRPSLRKTKERANSSDAKRSMFCDMIGTKLSTGGVS